MTSKRLAAGALVLALALAALASGGFSAMELDRNVEVEVVDDGSAMFSAEACYVPDERAQNATEWNQNNTTPVRIEVTNSFGGQLRIESVDGDSEIVSANPLRRTNGPAGVRSNEFVVPFRSTPSEITIVVSSNGVTAQITVTDILQCSRPVGS